MLPPEILEIPTYKRRLPWSVDLGHGTTWLYRELTACLLRDQYWEEEWRIREEHGLSRSQIAWLTINGGLPKIFLGGHAAPGWPWHFFAYSCHWKVLGQLLALGIPELDGGQLVSLQEIASIHGTSCREILELLLLDRIMCPLQDKEGLTGWPHDYVRFIVGMAAERRAGRHMRPVIHDTRRGWHVEFLEEPGHALAECERIRMTKSKN